MSHDRRHLIAAYQYDDAPTECSISTAQRAK
jgi:hypothetical protein